MALDYWRDDTEQCDMDPHASGRIPFPTMAEVEAASVRQLAQWYRLLVAPANKSEQRIMRRMIERFNAVTGVPSATGKVANGRPKARRKR